MDVAWYWVLGLAAILAAAFASWRVVTKGKYLSVKAKDHSLAAGHDVNVQSHNKHDSDP